MTRMLMGVLLVLASAWSAALAATPRVETVVDGLEHSWSAFLLGGRMLVTERPGRLRTVENGQLRAEPVTGLPAVFSWGRALTEESTRRVRKAVPVGPEVFFKEREQRMRDVREGPDGALYLLTDEEQAALLRVVPR